MNLKAKVISNIEIAQGYYRMTLNIGMASKRVQPGQFFNIRCNQGLSPLLRRPFSIHRIRSKGMIEILYKVVGEATGLLSKKKKGDTLDIIGPLGNGFPSLITHNSKPITILVAGGMGVAPLLFLAEKVMKIKNLVIIGAKTQEEVLCERDFKKLDFEVLVTTEDGSKGKKGLATDLLKNLLRHTAYGIRHTIYACGPNPMLKQVAKITKSKKVDAYGSFEEHMACGVGSCYGCVIKTKNGYKRICKDGPVFNLKEITW